MQILFIENDNITEEDLYPDVVYVNKFGMCKLVNNFIIVLNSKHYA